MTSKPVSYSRLYSKQNSDEEITLGLILRGPRSRLEEVVRTFEQRSDIKLCYVRRAWKGEYLLLIKTRGNEYDNG